MKRTLAFASVLVLSLVAAARAQAPAGPPKPGPEHKKLEYFAGKWTMEGDLKPSPFGPGGKVTATDNCEWFAGGFHIICRSEGKGPAGDMKSLALLGYSGEEKAYTYYGIDNMGMGSGTQTTPNAYTFKWEISQDGKTWTAVMEGKDTRAAR